MNYIDYIIVILIVISAISGAVKGLVHEVSSLIGLVGGVWFAIKFSGFLETFLVKRYDLTSKYIHVISFVIIMIIVIVLVAILAKVLEKAIESAQLSAVNRILGFVFSIFKTIFILGVLVILIESLHQALPFFPLDSVKESKFSSSLKVVTIKTFPFVQELFGHPERENGQKPEDKEPNEKQDSITENKLPESVYFQYANQKGTGNYFLKIT